MNRERIHVVTNELNEWITYLCYTVTQEQRYPRADADASDAYIKENKKQIAFLRKTRDEIENNMTGFIE